MKVTLNLFNPSFKAIQLSDDEKKQVTTTLYQLKDDELPAFKKNLLNADVIDVFYPHIQKEAAESDNPKAKSVDLNMKMFDALNSFKDKEDPLGWFMSVLNGTEYKEPKPTIFDIIEQQEEEERIAEEERRSQPFNPYANIKEYTPKSMYFDYDEDTEYTKQDIVDRAREMREYYGRQYRTKDMLNLIEQNPYLVEHDNQEFDDYLTAFADAVSVDKQVIKESVVAHPELMHFDFESINDKAEEYAQISGCREAYCKNVLIRKPSTLNRNPELMKRNLDAANFYKKVHGKEPAKPEAIFTSTIANYSYILTLGFLVSCADKDNLKSQIANEKQLIKHIKDNGIKPYRFIIPEDKMTNEFIDFAQDFSFDNFGEDIFDFTVVSPEEYNRIKKPLSFRLYINKQA